VGGEKENTEYTEHAEGRNNTGTPGLAQIDRLGEWADTPAIPDPAGSSILSEVITMIERRTLGKTGLEVAILGLGGANHTRVSQEELNRIMDRAEEVGANCLDLYYNCEEAIGRAVRGRREKFVLMSKVEIHASQQANLPPESRGTTAQIDASLRRLGTDYIDVCQLHYVTSDECLDALQDPGGVLAEMIKAQEQGKVRFLGITSHHPTVLARAIKTGLFATLMVPYNVIRRRYGQDPALGLFDLAQKLDVGTIIMKPFSYGHMFHNLSRAIQFIWAHPVTVVIPGATSLAQFDQNVVAARQFSAMSAGERARCRDEGWLLQEDYCTGCGYCLPCPSGMNIPELLRREQYVRTFGLTEWLSEERVGKLFVEMSRCADCGMCEEHCPRQLPIRRLLEQSGDIESRLDGARA